MEVIAISRDWQSSRLVFFSKYSCGITRVPSSHCRWQHFSNNELFNKRKGLPPIVRTEVGGFQGTKVFHEISGISSEISLLEHFI
jgi:hypothetical protein